MRKIRILAADLGMHMTQGGTTGISGTGPLSNVTQKYMGVFPFGGAKVAKFTVQGGGTEMFDANMLMAMWKRTASPQNKMSYETALRALGIDPSKAPQM